jgi:hypothetical protein
MCHSNVRPRCRLGTFLLAATLVSFLPGGGAANSSSGGSSGGNTPGPPISNIIITPAGASVQAGGGTQVFTATVQNDKHNKGVTWSLLGSGCSGSACGTLSASSSASGASITYTAPARVPSPATVTLTAASATNRNQVGSVIIIVTAPALRIATNLLPSGEIGVVYRAALAATGGTTPYAWSITSGTLPAGLSLNASTGTITGTPRQSVASSSLTFKVTDSANRMRSVTLILTITAVPASPTVTGVSPNTGPADGGTAVTISGSNFRKGATVLFGMSDASGVAVVNSSSITAITPAGAAGTKVNVTINNTDGTNATLANAYAYTTGGAATNHYEYVFTDGTLYVYNLDAVGFPLVKSKSIPTSSGTRGSVACAGNSTLYISIGGDGGPQGNGGLLAYDLLRDAVLWTQNYSHGIDSHAITSDCAVIYMPDGELANSSSWYVVDAKTGNETGRIAGSQASHPHNTIVFNGHVYLGGRQSTLFQAANVSDNTVYFTSSHTADTIRPFTINAEETAAYITETNFLGFEQADLQTGAIRFTVPVTGFSTSCSQNCPSTPSHGISMSPDEKWLYVLDSINGYVHVFDISGGVNVQPMQKYNVKLEHSLLSNESSCAYDCLGDGWLHHSFDGRYVFVGDSGDVIDTGIKSGYANPPTVVGFLPQMKNSRKEIEIDFQYGIVADAMTNRSSIGTGAR